MPNLQKTKFEHLAAMLANVIQMKSKHLIHMKAKFERLICRRRSLNVWSTVIAKVMQMKFEHLIHIR